MTLDHFPLDHFQCTPKCFYSLNERRTRIVIHWPAALLASPHVKIIHISGCCAEVEVVGYGEAYLPSIYTTYTIEDDLLNGKVHYTSTDRAMAIAYFGSSWLIQDATKRWWLLLDFLIGILLLSRYYMNFQGSERGLCYLCPICPRVSQFCRVQLGIFWCWNMERCQRRSHRPM